MAGFELTSEELTTLKDVLENDIARLRIELFHTDTREYRELLRHKEQILEKIFSVLEAQGEVRQAEAVSEDTVAAH